MSFKRLDQEDFITSADSIVSPTWSGNVSTLTTFYTSFAQMFGPSGKYYLDVYNEDPQLYPTAEVQFSIAYANKNGGGSVPYNSSSIHSPTSTIYGQMRSLLLEDENAEFNFGGVVSDDFYIININRARYKEKLMPGTWVLDLGGNGTNIRLTDNSNLVSLSEYYGTQRVYKIGEGFAGNGDTNSNISGSYGLFFPDTSLILLNPKRLRYSAIELSLPTASYTAVHNEIKLYNSINASESQEFTLQSEETITSNYVFVRARNSEFNYSSNPSYISGSTGELIHNNFIYNPQTYPTSVGLYNDSNELLAVAKLSKPLLKDSTKELLLRLRLDF